MRFFILPIFLFMTSFLAAQPQEKKDVNEKIPFLQQAETFNKSRFWTVTGIGLATYTGTMIALNQAWYADYEKSKFHLFDDRGEWEDMDKVGHFFSAYNESRVFYQGARWMGIKEKNAVWIGFGAGTILQASIEVLDGFSEKWGFSIADIGANTLGCAVFAGQQLLWQEQRFSVKVSSYRKPYSNQAILSTNGEAFSDLRTHADNLFGSSIPAIFLKDYNAQTIWLSGNIHSFLGKKESKFPKWLNIAVGYGAQNVFGGYGNTWRVGDNSFRLDSELYPRYRQFYLSFDIDMTRIKTKNAFLRTVLHLANMIKIPSPTLEWNTQGQLRFHPIYF